MNFHRRMNLGTKCNPLNPKQTLKESEKYSASRYALQVALHTMKDRCQKLQNRLSCLEEENLQLRIEKHKLSVVNRNEGNISISALEKKVAELNRQKSQLSHHILMVATENKELWQWLSNITEESECLGNHLLTISDTLNKQPRPVKPDTSIGIVESCTKNKDGKESLEEISLRVLSSLLKGKAMIENQLEENSQMMEVPNGSVSLEQCEFTLEGKEENEDVADDSLLAEMKEILERMKKEKETLKQQQEGLKGALEAFKKVSTDAVPCRRCISRAKEDKSLPGTQDQLAKNTSMPETVTESLKDIKEPPTLETPAPSFNLAYKEQGFEERICPLCSILFPKTENFEVFNEHVVSHFVEEDLEDTITSNSEIIT